jgi:alpha-D-ribose 1-methylphosphonate 5-triphosphate synthase subunit PhnG
MDSSNLANGPTPVPEHTHATERMHFTEIVAEGNPGAIRAIADEVVTSHEVRVIREPSAATVMVRSVDPLQKTPFNLGEVYVTECEVEVDGELGYGCVMGIERERSVYAAIIDAAVHTEHGPLAAEVSRRLEQVGEALAAERAKESARVAGTAVDFRTE